MDTIAVRNSYNNICSSIINRRVLDATTELKKLIHISGREYYMDQLEQHLLTYRNILRHSFSSIKDPEREKVYNYLVRNLLEMADEIKESILTESAIGNIYSLKKQLLQDKKHERKEALDYLEKLTFETELTQILNETGINEQNEAFMHEDALVKIFNIIWLSDEYDDTEIKLLQAVSNSSLLPWHSKSLIVSALTLSLLRFFDVNKFLILFRFIEARESFVWQRALVGLFMCSFKYNDRFYLYPALGEEVDKLRKVDDIEKNIEALLVQFTKTRETESVTRKWEEDILPRMMKLRPKIEEKLDLDNIFKEEFGEEKNPDWETVFEDAPDLLDKLQEFTELQMEGMDVFMSAFSQLKNFPFFQKISNWFVPFYHENKAIQPFLNIPGEQIDLTPLVQKLESTYFMCNSDKYSFCINLGMIPEQQKSMMMNMMNAEMEGVSEIEKGEGMINDFAITRSIYTQYFQDLYRFVKLHPWRGEFDDIFETEIDIFHTTFVSSIISDTKTIRNIAEFYFDKKFYSYALNIFLSLLERDRSNIELFEKIAFCYENQGGFENALDYYQRADLIEANRPWIIKKLALCCKYLNRWEKALNYYKQASKLEPDDLKLQANIGQCLIYMQEYDKALECYFKVEVLAPENHKIRRPLAWCSFIMGKFDIAQDYLQRLLATDPENMHDLMNLAHVFWCRGEEEKAFEQYLASIRAAKDSKVFENSFNEDRKHLIKHNISVFDMDLMLEYVKMNT
jgi:tetratricopeptide (TPR) repeat protein